MFGNGGDDYMDGSYGTDWLHGGSGPDFMDGGPGPDMLYGGTERDILAFRSDRGPPTPTSPPSWPTRPPARTGSSIRGPDRFGPRRRAHRRRRPEHDLGRHRRSTCNGNGGNDSFIDCP